MTETSPLVSLSVLTSKMDDLTTDERIDMRALQGLTMPGLEVRIVNEEGEVPWDGKTMGELTVQRSMDCKRVL